MRTTLSIDDDLLAAARERARHERKTVGEAVSAMMRDGLRKPADRRSRNGIPVLPVTNPRAVVTLEIVNALRDEAP